MPLRDKCAVLIRTPRAIKVALETLDELERERAERARKREEVVKTSIPEARRDVRSSHRVA